MWICSQCGEPVDDLLDSCWKCAGGPAVPAGKSAAPPEKSAATPPAVTRIEPGPLRREDDAGAQALVVKVVQHRLQADLTYDRIAQFSLDPQCSRSLNEPLSLRDGPALYIKIIYKADNRGLTVMLLQAGRDLLTLNTTGPADSFMTLRLSPASALTISIVRPRQ
jgi:hypothetical protein